MAAGYCDESLRRINLSQVVFDAVEGRLIERALAIRVLQQRGVESVGLHSVVILPQREKCVSQTPGSLRHFPL